MNRSTLFALCICSLLVCANFSFSQESKPLTGITFSEIKIDTSRTGRILFPDHLRSVISSEFVFVLLQQGAKLSRQGEPIQLLLSARSTTYLASKLRLQSMNLVVSSTVEMKSFDKREWIGVMARELTSKLARQYESNKGIAGNTPP